MSSLAKPASFVRFHPGLDELLSEADAPPNNLSQAAASLLHPTTGFVEKFRPLPKIDNEPVPPYFFHARLANHRSLAGPKARNLHASGKGFTLTEARTRTLGEAVECYSAIFWDYDEVVYASRTELEAAALNPAQLGLYLPEQYRQLPFESYNDQNVMGWVCARSLVSDKLIYIPALAVYQAYKPQQPDEFICPTTSNGLASGSTLANAILSAAFEVVERDAFIITWLNRLPCQRVDPLTHPNPDIAELCQTYQQNQVEILLFCLPTDQPGHVFMALSLQPTAPAVVVGLGAHTQPAQAAQQAILEMAQGRHALLGFIKQPGVEKYIELLVAQPTQVSTMYDHALRYAHPATNSAFDFLLNSTPTPFNWNTSPALNATTQLATLIDSFKANNQEFIYYNLTPPAMQNLGLHTVRVILPGLQPIYFGRTQRRLACNRLYQLPYTLGFTSTPTTPAQLNKNPHPFA